MKRHAVFALLAAGCALSAWGQARHDAVRAAGKPPVFAGGGIRGASAVVPEGVLVTAAEAQEFLGEAGYNELPMLRPRGVTPSIDILQPQAAPDLKLKIPFAISVVFKSQPDAAILPGTFKVLYGALKLDITERITRHVQISAQGFSFDKAQIPTGKHRLTLQVQDEKQRVAERELRFEVE